MPSIEDLYQFILSNLSARSDDEFTYTISEPDSKIPKQKRITESNLLLKLEGLSSIDKINALDHAWNNLSTLIIEERRSFCLQSALVFLSTEVGHRETVQLFGVTSKNLGVYKAKIINLFHKIAWPIIRNNISNNEMMPFLRQDSFVDIHTNPIQEIHGARTKLRDEISKLTYIRTTASVFHEKNPILDLLGDGTNADNESTIVKRTNKLNTDYLKFILHCTNTPIETLRYIEEAYLAIKSGTVKYAEIPLGVCWMKNIKYRHLLYLQETTLFLLNKYYEQYDLESRDNGEVKPLLTKLRHICDGTQPEDSYNSTQLRDIILSDDGGISTSKLPSLRDLLDEKNHSANNYRSAYDILYELEKRVIYAQAMAGGGWYPVI